jgi:hypothetical protein
MDELGALESAVNIPAKIDSVLVKLKVAVAPICLGLLDSLWRMGYPPVSGQWKCWNLQWFASLVY